LWKGHLSFKQYLSLKSSKFRIKTSEFWKPTYFHLRSFIVYNRKETALKSPLILKDIVKTTAIVLKLSETLLHKSCTLWLNNYKTCLDLIKFVQSCNTVCGGTTKINRKNVAKKVKEKTTEGSDYCAAGRSSLHSQVQ
jgi:hypothetical protein